MNNINIGINKLRGFLSRSIRETLNTEDGKRNLYFDYNRRNYIKFSLDVATTCESIFRIHKDEIKKNIAKLYGNNINLNNFAFLVVELKTNRFEGTENLINVKLRMNDKILFRVLSNSQLMLCYIIMNRQNIILKKNVRNYGLFNPFCLQNQNPDMKQKQNVKMKKDINIYYPKNTIFYYNYNAYAFTKEKMLITEEDITILAKPVYKLLIKDIKSTVSFLTTSEADSKQYLKNYKIYGEMPIFCLEIETNDNKKLLVGKNNNDQLKTLAIALDRAICNYQNHHLTFVLDNKIIQENINLYTTSNQLTQKGFFISDIVRDKSKRKSMFPEFNADIFDIIRENIFEFKNNLRKKKYLECIIKLKLIIDIIDNLPKEENNNINMISANNIEYLKGIWEKINILFKIKINNKNINNNDPEKKDIEKNCINENDNNIQEFTIENNYSKDNYETILGKDFINNFNKIMESVDKLYEFKKIINMNIFDNLYYEIKKKLISDIYAKNNINYNKEAKTLKIFKDDKLILGNCFINNFQMKKEEDFYNIGGKEFEKVIENYNKDLLFKKEGELSAF